MVVVVLRFVKVLRPMAWGSRVKGVQGQTGRCCGCQSVPGYHIQQPILYQQPVPADPRHQNHIHHTLGAIPLCHRPVGLKDRGHKGLSGSAPNPQVDEYRVVSGGLPPASGQRELGTCVTTCPALSQMMTHI